MEEAGKYPKAPYYNVAHVSQVLCCPECLNHMQSTMRREGIFVKTYCICATDGCSNKGKWYEALTPCPPLMESEGPKP